MYLDCWAAQGFYLSLTVMTLKRYHTARWYDLFQQRSDTWEQQGVHEELDLTSKRDEAKEGKGFELAGEAVIRMLEHRNK